MCPGGGTADTPVLGTGVFGRVGSNPSSGTMHHGGQARLGEHRTPNPVLQSSNLWSPAKSLRRMPKWSRRGIANPVLPGSSPGRRSMRRVWAIGSPAVPKTAAPKGHRCSNHLPSAKLLLLLAEENLIGSRQKKVDLDRSLPS